MLFQLGDGNIFILVWFRLRNHL